MNKTQQESADQSIIDYLDRVDHLQVCLRKAGLEAESPKITIDSLAMVSDKKSK